MTKQLKAFSAGSRVAKIMATSAVAATIALSGALIGCTSQPANTNNTGNTNNTTMNTADKPANTNANANANAGSADIFKGTCSLKGEVLGIQHVVSAGQNNLMISLTIEPDLDAATEAKAKDSKWEAILYYVAKDNDGNYRGSWASDPISYNWTFSERIEDTSAHIAVAHDLEGVATIDVYVAWAKGTFTDGSTVELNSKDNEALKEATQENAAKIAEQGKLIGTGKVQVMKL